MSTIKSARVATTALLKLLIIATAGIGELAMAYEEPAYEVIRQTEDYEIRRYAPYIVAETEVKGGFGAAGTEAFRILAGYIFGKNKVSPMSIAAEQPEDDSIKMAMTVPVFSTEAGQDAARRFTYSFVMPSEFSLETLPEPLDPRVQLRVVPERVVAVRRYSGRWSEQRFADHETELRRALERDGLDPAGATHLARYNGPWTPWFMRRNEVMIAVAGA
jgi:hypothetical protein